MTTEIITVGGRQYEINYAGTLTSEQRASVLANLGCSTCGNPSNKAPALRTLSVTGCPVTKIVGEILHLSATPSAGTPGTGYTITFKKGTATLQTFLNVPEGSPRTYDYQITAADAAAGTQIFSATVEDQCLSSHKITVENCSVTSNYQPCPPLSANLIGCVPSITVGAVGTLSISASGGLLPLSYSWTDNGVTAQTGPSISLSTLSVGHHSIVGTVRDSCLPTNKIVSTLPCEMDVYPQCGQPVLNYSVS